MNITSESNYSKSSVLVPANQYPARCIFVVDLGTQPDQKYGDKPKVQIGWELLGTVMPKQNPNDPDRPFVVSREYTKSFDKKANLRKIVELWLDVSYTDEQAVKVGFNPKELLGKECFLTNTHRMKQDNSGMKAEVSAVNPPYPGMQAPMSINPIVYFEIGAPDQFQTFPQTYGWLQEKIIKSPEFNAECSKYGMNAQQLRQQSKDAWKAQNPQQGQQQQSAMQPNQQWMQQGPPAGYGNPAQQQYQQPMQTGFNQNPQQPAQNGFNQQPNQQYSQNQQPQGPPPGYSQPAQYPNAPQQGFGGQQQNQRSMTPPPAQQQQQGGGFGQQQNQQQGGFGQQGIYTGPE